jgi:HTH-type transcriptional regulator/antitoxin MqsA
MTKENDANRLCHDCGACLQRDIRPMTVRYRGTEATFEQPGWYCPQCGEGVVGGEDLATTRIVRANLKAEVEGVLSPSEVKRIRTALHLSQRKAGELLGGGSQAFHKYESGLVGVSRAMSNLLRLLDSDIERLGELERAA